MRGLALWDTPLPDTLLRVTGPSHPPVIPGRTARRTTAGRAARPAPPTGQVSASSRLGRSRLPAGTG